MSRTPSQKRVRSYLDRRQTSMKRLLELHYDTKAEFVLAGSFMGQTFLFETSNDLLSSLNTSGFEERLGLDSLESIEERRLRLAATNGNVPLPATDAIALAALSNGGTEAGPPSVSVPSPEQPSPARTPSSSSSASSSSSSSTPSSSPMRRPARVVRRRTLRPLTRRQMDALARECFGES